MAMSAKAKPVKPCTKPATIAPRMKISQVIFLIRRKKCEEGNAWAMEIRWLNVLYYKIMT